MFGPGICRQKFLLYIWGNTVIVYTDHHALSWLLTKDLAGRLACWSLLLQEYSLTIVYKSGKAHANADCLSCYPVDQPSDSDDTINPVFALTMGDSNDCKTGILEGQRSYPKWAQIIQQLEQGRKHKNFILTANAASMSLHDDVLSGLLA